MQHKIKCSGSPSRNSSITEDKKTSKGLRATNANLKDLGEGSKEEDSKEELTNQSYE